jgi:hypothetical protein
VVGCGTGEPLDRVEDAGGDGRHARHRASLSRRAPPDAGSQAGSTLMNSVPAATRAAKRALRAWRPPLSTRCPRRGHSVGGLVHVVRRADQGRSTQSSRYRWSRPCPCASAPRRPASPGT